MSHIFHHKDISGHAFLVTGGAGFIGSHIAEYLLRNGSGKVRVIDNLANGFQSNIDMLRQYANFEFVEGDIRNMDVCLAACAGMDYVSHQAALGSVPRSIKYPSLTNDVNVGGFVNILKAAVDKGIKRFVYASSSSVYGDSQGWPKQEDRIGNGLSPYAVSKRTNELYATVFAGLYNISVIGFRYFNIFGPRQDPDGPYAAVIPLFVKGILKQTPVFINGDGSQTRDFTFVENAVQANILAMLTENDAVVNKVYNIAAGKNFSVNYLYDCIRNYMQSSHAPAYREARAGDVKDSLGDISLAENLLGYRPRIQFEDGLKITIDHFRNIYSPV